MHDDRLARNNFDLLRLVFASAVCLSHAHALSGYAELAWLPNVFSPVAAVKAFFVVSGFLIFMSYERSSSLRSYAIKRVRRIYPAYFTVVVVSAVVLAGVSTLPPADYFSSAWLQYLLANLAFLNFLHPGLPGVFETSPLPVINGALWTLKIEVMFYASVPLWVGLCRRFGHLPVLGVLYLASIIYAFWLGALADQQDSALYRELARQLPGQLSYFMAGAFFYYYLGWFERNRLAVLAFAAVVLFVFPVPALEPFAMAGIVAFCGLFLPVVDAGKRGDFSYGIYILHFPIIQVLVQADVFDGMPYLFLLVACVLTLCAAVAMWHVVEKRFLLRGSHYLAAVGAGEKI